MSSFFSWAFIVWFQSTRKHFMTKIFHSKLHIFYFFPFNQHHVLPLSIWHLWMNDFYERPSNMPLGLRLFLAREGQRSRTGKNTWEIQISESVWNMQNQSLLHWTYVIKCLQNNEAHQSASLYIGNQIIWGRTEAAIATRPSLHGYTSQPSAHERRALAWFAIFFPILLNLYIGIWHRRVRPCLSDSGYH